MQDKSSNRISNLVVEVVVVVAEEGASNLKNHKRVENLINKKATSIVDVVNREEASTTVTKGIMIVDVTMLGNSNKIQRISISVTTGENGASFPRDNHITLSMNNPENRYKMARVEMHSSNETLTEITAIDQITPSNLEFASFFVFDYSFRIFNILSSYPPSLL